MSDDELDALERLLADGDEDDLDEGSELFVEAADALREMTGAAGTSADTRARVLASLGGSTAAESDVCLEAAEALRLETETFAGSAETRARVLRSVQGGATERRGPRWAVWQLAAASVLVVLVGGSSALAATGNLDVLTRAWSGVAESLGLERSTEGRSRGPTRPHRAARAPSEPAHEPVVPSLEPTDLSPPASEGPAPAPVAPAPRRADRSTLRAARTEDAPRVETVPAVGEATVERATVATVEQATVEQATVERATVERATVERATVEPTGEASPEPLGPIDAAEHAAFREADRVYRSGRSQAALAAWDHYLERYPNGHYVLESRYNRALTLVRLGRDAQALDALEPFARGVHGGYRQRSASALSERLRARLGVSGEDAPGSLQ